jgi:SAM-dependent methyltransferase
MPRKSPRSIRTDRPHRDLPAAHWHALARHWDLLGPPLRPSAEDLAFYAAQVTEWANHHGPPRGLILGVTPELYHLAWPLQSTVTAVDRTAAMIEAVWPGARNSAICADWLRMPFPSGSHHIVLCDAGIVQLSHPEQTVPLVRSLHRILAPSGLCVLRLCVPPARTESVGAVLEHLAAGRIASPHVLKLRLGMALQERSESGVCLGTIWQTLDDSVPDLENIAEMSGWPAGSLATLEPYRESRVHYHFLDVDEVRHLFTWEPGGFTLEASHTPGYELGDRCPLLAFRRSSAPNR